jgi:mono/diheme cytochrome c family protein
MSSVGSMKTIAVIVLLVAGAVLALTHGAHEWNAPPEATGMKSPLAESPEVLAAGAALFDEKCANCHGAKGKGDGPEAGQYSVQPQDLTDAKMMASMTDGEIFWKISEGRRPMPTFKKQLTDEQRWQLVQFVRSLVPRPPPPPPEKKAPPAKKNAAGKKRPVGNQLGA